MKIDNKYILGMLMFFISLSSIAQSPEGISYQAVAKDASGVILANQTIFVKANILVEPVDGSEVYTEYSEYHTITTSEMGLFNLAIGQGTPIINSFANVIWTNGPTFMQIELDVNGSGNFETLGTRQILSVPYALYADQGEPGPVGPTGASGPAGPAGPTPASPPPCPPGQTGAQGAQGPPGIQGPNGLQGAGTNCWDTNANFVNEISEDINGDGTFTSADCRNPNGVQGVQGPQGAQGIQGPDGSPGNPGPSGPSGPPGVTGPSGIAGPNSDCNSPWTENGSNAYFNGGNVGIGTPNPTAKVDVLGSVCSNGVALSSDVRYKKNIAILTNALEKIMALQAVRYEFNTEEFPEREFPVEAQIGLIAQEVEAVMPELVLTKADGYKALDYAKIAPYLIEAIKTVKADMDVSKQKFADQYQALGQKTNELKAQIEQE